MPASSRKKKTLKKKKRKAKAAGPGKLVELEEAIREHCDLKNRSDAIEDLMGIRKKRIENLMSDLGLTKQVVEGFGSAAFSERRTFSVINSDKLVDLMPPKQLAALAKITADVYDAAKAEDIDIDEAVKVGKSPSLSVSRARSKLARERQKKHITEARKAAEARVEAHRAEWRRAAAGA